MNIAFFGYGKMAKAIEILALGMEHKIVLKVTHQTDLNKINLSSLSIDVAFEFSTPQAAILNITYCLEHQIRVVSGTTGWLNRFSEIDLLTKKLNGTFFYASNFSLGANLFFKLNKLVASRLKKNNYSAEINEVHHSKKKDAPSGTAVSLAEDIIGEDNDYSNWAKGMSNDPTQMPITSQRIADVAGTHKVVYKNNYEKITLVHEALNRDGFANGALAVAEWIMDKKGVLNMDDFLDE